MSRVLTNEQNYYNIADTIRQMKDVNTTYKPREMASALKDIYSNEVEGVLPLSFESNGMPLIDYRIDGANGGVGDLITDISDDNYGKYKVPVVVNGKNLFDEIYPNIEINTVKYISFALTNGEYTLSSNIPNGGSASLFLLAGQVNSGASTQNNGVWLNNPQTVNVIDGFLTIGYRIYGNMNPEDYETILVLGSTATDYEPYHEPTTTNIYLDEPIDGKVNIPSEYTEVEYIESTGTQYIDTNYTPVQGDDLEFKNVTINTFNGALFSAGTERYQLILLGSGSICYYKYFQTGNAAASFFSTITNGNIKVLNGNLYINNVLKVEANYGGAVNTTLNIFQRANNTSNLICKIGEIIISNNGIIKRDFIPCYRKSDNVAGLYDLVNNTFHTNQGTGNFIVGPIKANESISLSDTNVNIPTLDGTNVISIDTTVQPSNVYIQAPKDSEEIVYLTTILEEEI